MSWRAALGVGGFFAVVGIIYLLGQGTGTSQDRSGAVMLIALGLAMAFGLSVLLRGSREL